MLLVAGFCFIIVVAVIVVVVVVVVVIDGTNAVSSSGESFGFGCEASTVGTTGASVGTVPSSCLCSGRRGTFVIDLGGSSVGSATTTPTFILEGNTDV